uniref:U2A'/phosphoprotein 32 family A C-terminal domain-containing protein n=1 Tax=Chromera velia CCMP2878 TaxID=1169474 RepID=A0A0G4FPU7_9ALVE|eukprot:Cvel_3622.t1-p1 / transcript=Cvel_3622.t1 / gene=Cvel_3622 / organism=Chromera_velia_CCMP2878 / gene_product=Acidic leucine-rich nuclear phosphoprotein, putative / transcript_product=Acidic leucine-rich nuclear phosphoprotein, putative / location=Cvel_scaffold148:114935-117704(-) / protein_length=362 / sequence_SO=supercontig / SO=protein_coding / is_pseudo=false
MGDNKLFSKVLNELKTELEEDEGSLENETRIYMDGKKLLGFHPEETDSLKNCDSLLSLSLMRCNIKSLANLPKSDSIKQLLLSDNFIREGVLNDIANVPNLTTLCLGGNPIKKIDDLKPLTALTKLERLSLERCALAEEDEDNYRKAVFDLIPSLKAIDGQDREGNTIDDFEIDYLEEIDGAEPAEEEEGGEGADGDDEDEEDFDGEEGEFDDEEEALAQEAEALRQAGLTEDVIQKMMAGEMDDDGDEDEDDDEEEDDNRAMLASWYSKNYQGEGGEEEDDGEDDDFEAGAHGEEDEEEEDFDEDEEDVEGAVPPAADAAPSGTQQQQKRLASETVSAQTTSDECEGRDAKKQRMGVQESA